MNKKKFIRMLQHAYAAEYGAYLAYEGHWKSLKNKQEQCDIIMIQREELAHQTALGEMLRQFDAKPSKWRNGLFYLIGKTMSGLCYVTGRWAPMVGAAMIENIGVAGYWELANAAAFLKQKDMQRHLLLMMIAENKHEEYFLEKAGL